MRFLTLTLLLLVISVQAFAQTTLISDELSLRRYENYRIIGKHGSEVLVTKYRQNKIEIYGFDADMKISWFKELDFDGKRVTFLDVISNQEGFALVYAARQSKRTSVILTQYNAQAEALNSAVLQTYDKRLYDVKPSILLSSDKQRLAIMELEEKNHLKLSTYDITKGEVQWYRNLDIDALIKGRDFSQAVLDNEGQVYLVFEGGNSRRHIRYHKFNVLRVSADDIVEHTIDLHGKLTYDVTFIYDEVNRRLVGTGLYDTERMNRARGAFYTAVDYTQQSAGLVRFQTFDEDFMKVLVGRKNRRRTFDNSSIQKVMLRRDGGALMVVERQRATMRPVGAGVSVSEAHRMDYYFDDIILVAFHPDGRMHWREVLYKRQFSQDDGGQYSSFCVVQSPDRLRILYNDEISRQSSVSQYVVETEGRPRRLSVMEPEDTDRLQLCFRSAQQVSGREVIVPSKRRSRLQLVKLAY